MFAAAPIGALAQSAYPTKPIRLIVSFPPGGAIDIVSRVVGQRLSEGFGQQVIADNRPGANGIIAAETLLRSTADGYTLLAISSAHVINAMLATTPFDVTKDFAAIATMASSELMLVGTPSLTATTLHELVALARSRPTLLTYASSGNGNINHLAAELFNLMAEVRTQHVPYKGIGPALADVMGGHVQLLFTPPSAVIANVKSGRLRAYAISGDARLAALPQVPTFGEVGLAGFAVKYWFGIVAQAAAPPAIVDLLANEVGKVLALRDVSEKLQAQGLDPFVSTPAQFSSLMRADLARFAAVVKAANIKAD